MRVNYRILSVGIPNYDMIQYRGLYLLDNIIHIIYINISREQTHV
jgi:hypothetical protein